jgi:hypothetical protein
VRFAAARGLAAALLALALATAPPAQPLRTLVPGLLASARAAAASAQPLRNLAGALLSPAYVATTSEHQLIQGLDHVPLAVADLDQAAADFARLGFVT